MKLEKLNKSLCIVVCALVAATSWAQTSSGTSGSSGQSSQPGSSSQSGQYSSGSQSGQPSQPGQPSSSHSGLSATGRGSGTTAMSHSQQSLRASKQVMNASVKSQDGQDLGQIEDLIVNPQSGRVEFAVISVNNKLHAVPFQLLRPSSDMGGTGSGAGTTTGAGSSTGTGTSTTTGGGLSSLLGRSQVTFVAQVEKQKIEQSPSIERSQWPTMNQQWSQQIYSHYGVSATGMGAPGTGTGTSTGGSTTDDSDDESSSPTTPPTTPPSSGGSSDPSSSGGSSGSSR